MTGPSVDVGRLAQDAGRHALGGEDRADGLGRQARVREAGGLRLGPGVAQEGQQARVVDRGDRCLTVLGGVRELEPAIVDERLADPLGSLGDLVGRNLDTEDRLERDLMAQVPWRVDDTHRLASRSRGWQRRQRG